MSLLKTVGLSLATLAVVLSASCAGKPGPSGDIAVPGHTTIYSYDAAAETWITNAGAAASPTSGEVYAREQDNTLIIQLRSNTPIRQITIEGGFVAGGGDPILDIDGDPEESGGAIRIGTLTMDTVDALRMQIRDTQVVSSNMTNMAVQDNELELSYQTVTVVFVERGANSVLSIKDSRLDRIRILGEGGGVDTHLETLTVVRSGFLGRIRIEDAKIDTLLLKNISLEE